MTIYQTLQKSYTTMKSGICIGLVALMIYCMPGCATVAGETHISKSKDDSISRYKEPANTKKLTFDDAKYLESILLKLDNNKDGVVEYEEQPDLQIFNKSLVTPGGMICSGWRVLSYGEPLDFDRLCGGSLKQHLDRLCGGSLKQHLDRLYNKPLEHFDQLSGDYVINGYFDYTVFDTNTGINYEGRKAGIFIDTKAALEIFLEALTIEKPLN